MAPKSVRPGASESTGDYIKAILDLGGASGDRVSTKALAARLGVRTPSVTGMLQKLAVRRPALVLYEKHRGVRLTAAGKRRAWELVRHHRLLELFLHDVLKYSWDEVHEEAERLEHFISERFEDRVAAILNDPAFDPHGHAIPRKDGSGVFRNEVALARWPIGAEALVSSVCDRSPEALRQLEKLGLKPGVALTVEQRNPAAALLVRLAGRDEPVRVNRDLADCILLSPPR